MARAPFQILVLLYARCPAGFPRYAAFRRADSGLWQGIAGGGQDDETPEQAALREGSEEAGLAPDVPLVRLDSVGQVPVTEFRDRAHWPAGLLTVPEYSFAAAVSTTEVRLSAEHDAVEWLSYAVANERLEWPSNRSALAELHQRLTATPPAP